ncbi:hypothetical protein K458DRAFT_441050 [Lentithecium fluviatile CBS 122367]|uniref:Core domain-containing protein n=1 Tax=Lentithecium fluviatile CBS 122367 TaxID=1168545 RepID=A0A6G1J9H3_9PLEO|nr:hypothetical protein K458DRAFT_441050 [Lentithecium fluviatile CBS 122367]
MASPLHMCASCLRAARRVTPRPALRPTNWLPPTSRTYTTAPADSQRLSRNFDLLTPPARRAPRRRPAIADPSARRALATTASPPAATTPSTPSTPQPAHAILHPRTTPTGDPMSITLSPRASQRLSKISAQDANPSLALRVAVESGGCHGFQYLMNLIDLSKSPAAEEDTVFESAQGAKVVIDEASLELLNGSTVDYTMELIGSQFKVVGIPGATSSCGCGTSFDIKI